MIHGDLPRQHSFGTTLRFIIPVAADSQIARPNKLGADPMACGGLNKEMDAAAELERDPVRKH